jgi:predicted Zn-dependent protease
MCPSHRFQVLVAVLIALTSTVSRRVASAQTAPRAALRAGVEARAAGHLREAARHLEVAVRAAPTWVLARLELAEALLRLGAEPKEIGEHLEAARLIDPENPRLYYLQGLNHEAAGHEVQAAAAFETALELRPSLDAARLRLGRLLLREDKAEEAVLHLRRYAEGHPGEVAGWSLLAQAAEATGDLGLAERALREVTRRFPENAYHWQRLADFYRRHGWKAKARRALAQAERRSPRRRRKLRPLPPSRR